MQEAKLTAPEVFANERQMGRPEFTCLERAPTGTRNLPGFRSASEELHELAEVSHKKPSCEKISKQSRAAAWKACDENHLGRHGEGIMPRAKLDCSAP
jgi:hypothetical protein